MIIKCNTNGEISVREFPDGINFREELCKFIDNNCSYYETVKPKRLYSMLGHISRATARPGQAVCMLVDEEGATPKHNSSANPIASMLYEIDIHGIPIMGNVLFVGEKLEEYGVTDICDMDSEVFEILKKQLEQMSVQWKNQK